MFNKLLSSGMTRELPQAQKYHSLLIKGLDQNIDGQVFALSAIPVNSKWTKQVMFASEEEHFGSVHFLYGAFVNLPVLRQLTRMCVARWEIGKLHKRTDDCVLICDVRNQSLADAARACGRKLGIPVVGIVTDVAGYGSGAGRASNSYFRRKMIEFAEKRASRNLPKYDAYLLLTEAMNGVVNKNGKPYIVLEGHCDSSMAQVENSPEGKRLPKVAMYAGGVHKEYGIERLVTAFIKGGFADWELHIYGDGNYQKDLTELSASVSNLVYYGSVPNEVVVKQQLKATLLLNPRLTDAEYVKYSFPSKTMECMASGTPLCTTRLPGMPKEYYPYLYFFDDETEDGMLATLREILAKDASELHDLGCRAKEFVLREKTNIQQAKKLVEFIKSL